jgi:S1-C subfamily serine protease
MARQPPREPAGIRRAGERDRGCRRGGLFLGNCQPGIHRSGKAPGRPWIARRLGLDDAVTGVVVISVEATGPAARAGIRPRDVITHVQDDAVASTSQFRAAVRRHDPKDGARLVVRSGSMRRIVFLQLRE